MAELSLSPYLNSWSNSQSPTQDAEYAAAAATTLQQQTQMQFSPSITHEDDNGSSAASDDDSNGEDEEDEDEYDDHGEEQHQQQQQPQQQQQQQQRGNQLLPMHTQQVQIGSLSQRSSASNLSVCSLDVDGELSTLVDATTNGNSLKRSASAASLDLQQQQQQQQQNIECINRSEACVFYVLSQLAHGDKPSPHLINNFELIVVALLTYLRYAHVRNPRFVIYFLHSLFAVLSVKMKKSVAFLVCVERCAFCTD